MRRWMLIGGAVALAAGAVTVGVAVGARDRNHDASASTAAAASNINMATVTRRDLARTKELDGTVGYGAESALTLALDGTLTGVPAAGAVIDEGSVVVEVDGQPVVVLIGERPMWRDLGPGVEDGVDVLAVEQALERLGYAAEFDVTVDGEWTNATTRAVKAFQEDHGQTKDGTIAKGEVVVLHAPRRIAEIGGVAGQQSSEAAIKVTPTEPTITAKLKLADATLVNTGDTVDVVLPDGMTVPGTVESIGAATTDDNGNTTLPMTVIVEGGVDLPIGSKVDVNVAIVAAEQVLAVPVEAVLAVAEGGFAVEVKEGASTRLVRVELGVFADGFVEIRGDVDEGAEVVVP